MKKRQKRQRPVNLTSLVTGDQIDARDLSHLWCRAQVIDVRVGAGVRDILVHYHGWSCKWDEWIAEGSDRIAQADTHWRPAQDHSWGATFHERYSAEETLGRVIQLGLADCAAQRNKFASLMNSAIPSFPTVLAALAASYLF